MAGALHDLVSAPEFWRGVAASLVVADAVTLPRLLPGHRPGRHRRRGPWAAPVISVVAAFAVYVTVPDTERALVVLGGVAGGAAAALVLRLSWPVAALGVTAALVWVALEDGPPRTSAVVGALAVAVLHVLLQHRVTAAVATTDGLLVLVVLSGAAMSLLARVAGRGGGLARPLVVAGVLVVGTEAIARRIGRRSVRA